MTLNEAKEAISFKYFREKWITLSRNEQLHHYDEVCELYAQSMADNFSISDVSERKFNLNELSHIAVNFAINCEKGYKGDFNSWFNGISSDWRKIANREQYYL